MPVRAQPAQRPAQLGARILFFSGGSALGEVSRVLKRYTHSSIHLVTPFDSGGSSAALRQAFDMLSVGDLRSRLMALADETALGSEAIHELFDFRLPQHEPPTALAARLAAMVDGDDPRIAAVPSALRPIVQAHMRSFAARMPAGFDLRGASAGNLILVGGYLDCGRDIEAVILAVSKLASVLGFVAPVVDRSLHLEAELDDGSRVLGQHRITGKSQPALGKRIVDLRLTGANGGDPVDPVAISPRVQAHLESAELICYPMGSFWTSVACNLLPRGIGRAIRASDAPKLYIPNLGSDPEQAGMTIAAEVEVLARLIARDVGADAGCDRAVQYVLVDAARGEYGARLDPGALRRLGVEVIDMPMVTGSSAPLLDAERVGETLLSFRRSAG